MAPRTNLATPAVDIPLPYDDVLVRWGLTVGMEVRVDDEPGTFTLTAVEASGAVTCRSDDGFYRSFRPEWCYSAWRINRRNNRVKTKIPDAQKGLRARWRIEHGFAAPEKVAS